MKCMHVCVCVHVCLCVHVNYKNDGQVFCYINTCKRHSNKKCEKLKQKFLAVKAGLWQSGFFMGGHTHTISK